METPNEPSKSSKINLGLVLCGGLSLLIALLVGMNHLLSLTEIHPPVVRVVHQPDVIMDVLDPSLEDYSQAWQVEISRRFHNAVGVLCHGGSVVHGQWLALPHPGSAYAIEPVEQLIHDEEARFPGRTIVLLCCNVQHETLHNYPGVYYAASSVWCLPDRDVPPFATSADMTIDDVSPLEPNTIKNRSADNPDYVGNIFEFQSAE